LYLEFLNCSLILNAVMCLVRFRINFFFLIR
jgi:hypothetical protein